MNHVVGKRLLSLIVVASCGLAMAACSSSNEPGKESITVVSPDEPGAAEATRKIAKEFTRQTGIDVKLSQKPMVGYVDSVPLTASGPDAPDVIQGDHGWVLDGSLVEQGLIVPLQKYSDEYGWADKVGSAIQDFRWSGGPLDENRKVVWGSGDVYGLGSYASIRGVFYNKKLLAQIGGSIPTSVEDFNNLLASAKNAGITPIVLAGQEGWQSIDLYQITLSAFQNVDATRDFIYHKKGATFDTPENLKAAELLSSWAASGYFQEGFQSASGSVGDGLFDNGGGLFEFSGDWRNSSLSSDFGFFAFPDAKSTIYATNNPYHVTAASKKADLAAKYIDFMTTSSYAAKTMNAAGLATMTTPPPATKGTVNEDTAHVFRESQQSGTTVGSILNAAPGFTRAFYPAIQELLSNQASPDKFVSTVQAAYEDGYKK